MPTYQYRCKACGHELEEFQSMSAAPLVKCPKCGKKKLVRVISGAGLVFKGSGFYLTDYKKQGSSSADATKETKTPAPEGGSKPADNAEGKSSGEAKKGKKASSTGESSSKA